MIKFVKESHFEALSKYYKIIGNDKIVIAKLYSKGFARNCLRDLKECFSALVASFIGVVLFPIYLISTLYNFIPKIIIKRGK